MQDIKPTHPIIPVTPIDQRYRRKKKPAMPKPKRKPDSDRAKESDQDDDLPHIDEYV